MPQEQLALVRPLRELLVPQVRERQLQGRPKLVNQNSVKSQTWEQDKDRGEDSQTMFFSPGSPSATGAGTGAGTSTGAGTGAALWLLSSGSDFLLDLS